jgi:hypothetical protein
MEDGSVGARKGLVETITFNCFGISGYRRCQPQSMFRGGKIVVITYIAWSEMDRKIISEQNLWYEIMLSSDSKEYSTSY